MNNSRETARSCFRKVRFDARHRILRRQDPAASHRAQSLARFQFRRRLLKRVTTSDEKKRNERGNYDAEAHDDECEAMLAKSDHGLILDLNRCRVGDYINMKSISKLRRTAFRVPTSVGLFV